MGYLDMAKKIKEEMGLRSDPAPTVSMIRPIQVPSLPIDSPQDGAPIKPGWCVAYRQHRDAKIEGGRVRSARREGSAWTFTLENGEVIHEKKVTSVAMIEGGKWMGAWSVREHGLSGEGLFE